MDGLTTSSTEIDEATRAVRVAVAATTGSDRAADGVRVCATRIPGDVITIDPVPWWQGGGWRLPSGPRPPGLPPDAWVVAIYLDQHGWNAARMVVLPRRPTDPAGSFLPKSDSLVGLSNDTDWAKEIRAENVCSGSVRSVFQPGRSASTRWMTLGAASGDDGEDTVLFRKPGFLGIWHDVGHFRSDQYWAAFGGTSVDYRWRRG
ncbi:hypothetical protein [Nocardioides euryhalodurans]|uniref:Uncharacterized protein n=1 Tax=Nocardioides euryhalodurans TaxID=2518370 RepID=A0A4P7GLH8_9ACTN|nr:hypothetical protein [Nocardioides euryhalodurans]QBR92719.1 hypothetical protein EXE57_10855 [Nocardioides euryhalodurans]